MRTSPKRHGFTTIELMIVVAIIAILAGLLFPFLHGAQESAKNDQCLNNLRQWGVALTKHVSERPFTFPGVGTSVEDKTAWFNVLPRVIENPQPPMSELVKSSVPLPGNGSGSLFLCPSDDGTDADASGKTFYSSYAFNKSISSSGWPLRHSNLKSPQTFVVMTDTCRGSRFGVDVDTLYDGSPDAFRHNGKVNVLFAGGSASSQPKDVIEQSREFSPFVHWTVEQDQKANK